MVVTVPNFGVVAGGLITATIQISMVGLIIIVHAAVSYGRGITWATWKNSYNYFS